MQKGIESLASHLSRPPPLDPSSHHAVVTPKPEPISREFTHSLKHLIKIEETFWQSRRCPQSQGWRRCCYDPSYAPSLVARIVTAAKAIVDAAVKANTADAAAKANCSCNFKRHIIDNFKAAKKTCKAHVVELQRQSDEVDLQFSLIVVHRSVWYLHAVSSFHFSVSFSEFWISIISWIYEHVCLTSFIEITSSLSA